MYLVDVSIYVQDDFYTHYPQLGRIWLNFNQHNITTPISIRVEVDGTVRGWLGSGGLVQRRQEAYTWYGHTTDYVHHDITEDVKAGMQAAVGGIGTCTFVAVSYSSSGDRTYDEFTKTVVPLDDRFNITLRRISVQDLNHYVYDKTTSREIIVLNASEAEVRYSYTTDALAGMKWTFKVNGKDATHSYSALGFTGYIEQPQSVSYEIICYLDGVEEYRQTDTFPIYAPYTQPTVDCGWDIHAYGDTIGHLKIDATCYPNDSSGGVKTNLGGAAYRQHLTIKYEDCADEGIINRHTLYDGYPSTGSFTYNETVPIVYGTREIIDVEVRDVFGNVATWKFDGDAIAPMMFEIGKTEINAYVPMYIETDWNSSYTVPIYINGESFDAYIRRIKRGG